MDVLFEDHPVFLITGCTFRRKPVLATDNVSAILVDEWRSAPSRHGWNVSRYVIMPDHVHFFCAARQDASSLEEFVGRWKEWTSKRLIRELGFTRGVWQGEFHDHLVRSDESYAEKWDYVYKNPVRAGLVQKPEFWPYSGEIVEDPGL
jgi:REP element-mobilizing transposase RayT